MLSLLLLAAGALAADPYFLLLDLSALSPLLRYSPLPGQNTTADQWTAIENITDGTGSSDMPMRLFGGASVSFSMPAGVSVWVYGDLSGEAAVTVDGEPADASIVQTQNIYVRWLTLEVPGGVGPHNVSVTVKGNASVSAISGHRQGNGEICLSSTGPHDRCFEGHFEGWGSYKPITATLTGSWLITDSKIAVTRDPGASALMQVPSNASWVEIEGWNSGSYEVRCMPTPPNSTAGAITYNGYVDMSGRWKPDLLYAAELDPHIKYAVEITHRSNTTAVRQMQSWVYVPKPKSNLSLGIGIGVGVGMGVLLAMALVYWCRQRQRRKQRANTHVAAAAAGDTEFPKAEEQTVTELCKVCRDRQPAFAVVECGHLCMCSRCARRIMAERARCPACNVAIVQQPVRIYRP